MLRDVGPVTVSTPGTPVQIISVLDTNDPLAGKAKNVHGVMVQALPSNAGKIYVGREGMNKGTFVGVLAFLAIPTDNVIPSFSAALTAAPNAINLSDLWIDVDNGDEGVIVTILQL